MLRRYVCVQEFEGVEGGLWPVLVRRAGCALYDALKGFGEGFTV